MGDGMQFDTIVNQAKLAIQLIRVLYGTESEGAMKTLESKAMHNLAIVNCFYSCRYL